MSTYEKSTKLLLDLIQELGIKKGDILDKQTINSCYFLI